MTPEVQETIKAFFESSLIGNLLLLFIYSLTLIAASAWVYLLAFRRGKDERNVELEAMAARQDEILEQLRLATTVIQQITMELTEQFSIRTIRREKLERILHLIRKYTSEVSDLNEITHHRSREYDDPFILKGMLRRAKSPLIQLQAIAALYFSNVSRETEEYVTTALAITAENWAMVTSTDDRYSTEQAIENNRRLLAAERTYTAAILNKYAKECGVEDYMSDDLATPNKNSNQNGGGTHTK